MQRSHITTTVTTGTLSDAYISVTRNGEEINSLSFNNNSSRQITIIVTPAQNFTLSFKNNRYSYSGGTNGVYTITHKSYNYWPDTFPIIIHRNA